ncbi:hypothetical protein CHELA1G11_13800 [Hyphomicrobiales bacterium]|nr:hypothetical protein CHELA1G2_10515 [Hyphomicrobiales bacterium]CAH1674134.1 hypothetical protein CHELA1G11_13800 [Hyphomicrobiales bacterium]
MSWLLECPIVAGRNGHRRDVLALIIGLEDDPAASMHKAILSSVEAEGERLQSVASCKTLSVTGFQQSGCPDPIGKQRVTHPFQ